METIHLTYDVVVIGSGGAGSAAAHAASQNNANALVVSKDRIAANRFRSAMGEITRTESDQNAGQPVTQRV